MTGNHGRYYLDNRKYSDFLDNQDINTFSKYIDFVIKYTSKGDRVLDVGCGTGLALYLLKQRAKREASGIDISTISVEKCKQKKLNCQVYNRREIPFPDDYFDLVGSYNVLEHVDYPENFLNMQLKVLKKGRYLIIACPNFLSITNNYHHHTRGVRQKAKNIFSIIQLLISRRVYFEKMEPIISEDFRPDDNAVNVVNPISILKWAKKNNLGLEYWSSQSVYRKGIVNYLDHSFLRLFLGSAFMVFRKLR